MITLQTKITFIHDLYKSYKLFNYICTANATIPQEHPTAEHENPQNAKTH